MHASMLGESEKQKSISSSNVRRTLNEKFSQWEGTPIEGVLLPTKEVIGKRGPRRTRAGRVSSAHRGLVRAYAW